MTSSDNRVEPTDSELFEGMARGDLGSLGELFDRHHAAVRACAERMVGDSADAADLVQETFLTASRAAASFQSGAPARPFLLGVAAQLVRRRRRSFARLRVMLDAVGRAPMPAAPTPENELIEREQMKMLDAAVAKLAHSHRELILMVDVGGLSGVEAAKALRIPPGTVWRRLHEARAELRERMKRRLR